MLNSVQPPSTSSTSLPSNADLNDKEDNVMQSIDNPSVNTPDDVFSMKDLESVKQTLGENFGASSKELKGGDSGAESTNGDVLQIGKESSGFEGIYSTYPVVFKFHIQLSCQAIPFVYFLPGIMFESLWQFMTKGILNSLSGLNIK